MRRHALQTSLAWLCLAVFTLTSVAVPRGLVMCQDEHGVRFELGCERDDHGHCEEGVADAHPSRHAVPAEHAEHEEHAEQGRHPACGVDPCRDTPVRHEIVASRSERARSLPVPPAVTLAPLPAPFVVEPERLALRARSYAASQPPPGAHHLRSVVILV
jgi:hypothetical protein